MRIFAEYKFLISLLYYTIGTVDNLLSDHLYVSLCYGMLYGYLYSASRRKLFSGALSVTGR